jgi:hypothetical protein
MYCSELFAHGRWFSPGTPASSTTKTGRHDIAEILLKVALNTTTQTPWPSFFSFQFVSRLIDKLLFNAQDESQLNDI